MTSKFQVSGRVKTASGATSRKELHAELCIILHVSLYANLNNVSKQLLVKHWDNFRGSI